MCSVKYIYANTSSSKCLNGSFFCPHNLFFVLFSLVALRWEQYLQNNLTFAEKNEGEYQTDQDAATFLNILDIITNAHNFRLACFRLVSCIYVLCIFPTLALRRTL